MGEQLHEPPSMPWDRGPSILEFIRSHIVAGKPGLADGAETLPDEEQVSEGSDIRWSPGALDGVLMHHVGPGDSEEPIRRITELTVAYSAQPTAVNKAAVYEHIIDEGVVSIIDPVLEALLKEQGINQQRLYELAHSFVTEAPDREPVKFGIAVLGLFGRPDDLELFQTLGRHEEFTLFASVAIANSAEDAEASLWELAKNVSGWGRIHLVERLSETTDPKIKDWLLREGFRNSVEYGYLAATCARAGNLLAALTVDHADRDLLTAAGDILESLIAGGPAEGIDDYEDARPVIESFLHHMESSAETVDDFLYIHAIDEYLGQDDSRWSQRYAAGWTPEVRKALRARADSILARPDWAEKVREQLDSDDQWEFYQADQAAEAIGVDSWEQHWRRLQDKPSDPARWFYAAKRSDEHRIAQVVEYAEATLDLAAIATGPADELGLGPGFKQHSCLDFVLQELRRFPGQAATLIETGLKSPVVRNRNMATLALAQWPRERWPEHLERSLQEALQQEPKESVRDLMQKALRGEPLPE